MWSSRYPSLVATALAASALLGGCLYFEENTVDDEPTNPGDPIGNPPPERPSRAVSRQYRLVPYADFAAPSVGGVVGVAWDGEALWAVTSVNGASYYDPDHLELVRMSLEGRPLGPRIALDDHWEGVVGVGWSGGKLWLNYSGGWGSNGFLRSIDLATGAEGQVLGMPPYYNDVEVVGDRASVVYAWNSLQQRSLVDGSILSETPVPYFRGGDTFGVAAVSPAGRAPELWLSESTVNELAIVADNRLVAFAVLDVVPAEWHREGVGLQFAGDRLAVTAANHVYVYDVVRD